MPWQTPGPTSKGTSQNKSSASGLQVGASSRPPSVLHPDLPPRESGRARFPVLVAFLFHILFPLMAVTDSLVAWCFVFHAFLTNLSPCWEPLVCTPSCLAASRWLWFHSPHDRCPEPLLLQALPQIPPPALLRMAHGHPAPCHALELRPCFLPLDSSRSQLPFVWMFDTCPLAARGEASGGRGLQSFGSPSLAQGLAHD